MYQSRRTPSAVSPDCNGASYSCASFCSSRFDDLGCSAGSCCYLMGVVGPGAKKQPAGECLLRFPVSFQSVWLLGCFEHLQSLETMSGCLGRFLGKNRQIMVIHNALLVLNAERNTMNTQAGICVMFRP